MVVSTRLTGVCRRYEGTASGASRRGSSQGAGVDVAVGVGCATCAGVGVMGAAAVPVGSKAATVGVTVREAVGTAGERVACVVAEGNGSGVRVAVGMGTGVWVGR